MTNKKPSKNTKSQKSSIMINEVFRKEKDSY